MTTTFQARFDGKAFIPYGHIDLPVDEDVTLQVAPPSVSRPSHPARRVVETEEELLALFEEMDKHSVHAGNSIDYSRESCYDDTIHDPD